jgi:hypothetical protein
MERTELARGPITRAHELSVTLEEPERNPSVVVIHWPTEATITTPHPFQATVNKCRNVLARATVQLAQIRRDRKL